MAKSLSKALEWCSLKYKQLVRLWALCSSCIVAPALETSEMPCRGGFFPLALCSRLPPNLQVSLQGDFEQETKTKKKKKAVTNRGPPLRAETETRKQQT